MREDIVSLTEHDVERNNQKGQKRAMHLDELARGYGGRARERAVIYHEFEWSLVSHWWSCCSSSPGWVVEGMWCPTHQTRRYGFCTGAKMATRTRDPHELAYQDYSFHTLSVSL